jgi:hypothetical protein
MEGAIDRRARVSAGIPGADSKRPLFHLPDQQDGNVPGCRHLDNRPQFTGVTTVSWVAL